MRCGGNPPAKEAEEQAIFQLIEVTLFGGEEVIYPTELVEPVSKAIVDDCKIEREAS